MELCSVVTRITPGRKTANRDQHTALPHALPPYGSTAVLVVFKTDEDARLALLSDVFFVLCCPLHSVGTLLLPPTRSLV